MSMPVIPPLSYKTASAWVPLRKPDWVEQPPAGTALTGGVFSNWRWLTKAPAIDYSATTDFTNMFNGCYALTDVSNVSIPSGATNTSSMFNNCTSLTNSAVNGFNVPASVINVSGMFGYCESLTSVPTGIDFSIRNTVTSLFRGTGITSSNGLNVTNATSIQLLFSGCPNITSITNLRAPNATSWASVANSCPNLTTFSMTDASGITAGGSQLFTASSNVSSVILPGLTRGVNLAGLNMNATALNALFNSLGTAASGTQIITIANNPGAATCDRTIATNKGFTVSG